MVQDYPSQIQAFGLLESRSAVSEQSRDLVETGPATFPGPQPTRALVLGARPNLRQKNAFPRSEGRKNKKNHSRAPS